MARYPAVDGVPVPLDEAASLFKISDFIERSEVTSMDLRNADELSPRQRSKRVIKSMIPEKSASVAGLSA